MSLITRHKRAFTLIEVMTAVFISLFVFLGAWSVYVMSWRWWHETAPRIEAQRIARVTLSSIIEGAIDSSAGTDAIGATVYQRRSGIAWALYAPTISAGINANGRIDFGLESDSVNARAYYLTGNAATRETILNYRNAAGNVHQINATRGDQTRGMANLTFTYPYIDSFGASHDDIVMVAVTVEGEVTGTRGAPYQFADTYTEIAYLRNL